MIPTSSNKLGSIFQDGYGKGLLIDSGVP